MSIRTAMFGGLLVLSTASCGDESSRHPAPVAGGAVVRAANLPRVGSVWDAPETSIGIRLAADGTITAFGREVGLDDLRRELGARTREPKDRDSDGASTHDVVLRVAPTLPWTVVQWVMAVASEPAIGLRRFHFAVLPEAGGAEGVIPIFLPRARSPSSPPFEYGVHRFRATLWGTDAAMDRGAIFAALSTAIAATKDKTVEVAVPPPLTPRTGHVLSFVDLALRAGAEGIHFDGTMPALPQSGNSTLAGEPGSIAWLRAWVAEHATDDPVGLTVRVGRMLIGPSSPTAPIPAPPARRPRSENGAFTATGPLPEVPAENHDPGPRSLGGWRHPRAFDGRSGGGNPTSCPTSKRRARSDVRSRGWLRTSTQTVDGGRTHSVAGCNGRESETDAVDGKGEPAYDIGTTGFALLAFLGAGYTNRSEGPFGQVIGKGLKYLRNLQDADGCFGPRPAVHADWNHAIATLAMVEAFGMTGSSIYKSPAQRSLDYIAKSRDPGFGRRDEGKPGDVDPSIAAWTPLVLAAAKWINEVDEATGRPPPLVVDVRDSVKDPIVRGLRKPPVWSAADGSIDFTRWQWDAIDMARVGDVAAARWRGALSKVLVAHQRTDGDPCGANGSWDPIDAWGPKGGRVHSTAMATLALEAPYRYPRPR